MQLLHIFVFCINLHLCGLILIPFKLPKTGTKRYFYDRYLFTNQFLTHEAVALAVGVMRLNLLLQEQLIITL